MKTIALFNDHGWAEDTRFPHADWQEEVNQESTVLGYSQWLVHQYEQRDIQVLVIPEGAPDGHTGGLVSQDATERFPMEDWKHEVLELSTRLGYEDWVAHQAEAAKA